MEKKNQTRGSRTRRVGKIQESFDTTANVRAINILSAGCYIFCYTYIAPK